MNTTVNLQETDPSGLETLARLAEAQRFNKWMFDTIVPHCKGHVLEVGSGIGNISKFFLEKNFRLTCSDLRDEYLEMLKGKFGHLPNLAGVRSIDLVEEGFEQKYADLLGQFDSIVALNVIEHIEDNKQAIANCKKMLKPGGHVVILVPAYQSLYNPFDKELGHFMRYTSRTLNQLLRSQDLEVFHTQYFNAVGTLGWFVNGSILRKKMIPGGQLQLFDKLMPVIKLVDTVTFHKLGLSVVSAARKTR